MTALLSTTLFPTLMILAGAGDALTMRIPNWLNILIALLFFPMALLTGMPVVDIGLHVAVGVGMFVLGFALFSLGLFGGGDAKLLAAAGLWLGWPDLLNFLVVTAIAGGILALCVGAWSVIRIQLRTPGRVHLQALPVRQTQRALWLCLCHRRRPVIPRNLVVQRRRLRLRNTVNANLTIPGESDLCGTVAALKTRI